MVLPVRIACGDRRGLGQYNCSGFGKGASVAEAKKSAYQAAGDDAIKQMLQHKAPFCATNQCSLHYEVRLGRGVADGPATDVVYKDASGKVIATVYGWFYAGIAEVDGVCSKVRQPAQKAKAKKLEIG